MVHMNGSFSAVLKDLQLASKHPQLELQPPSLVYQLPKELEYLRKFWFWF